MMIKKDSFLYFLLKNIKKGLISTKQICLILLSKSLLSKRHDCTSLTNRCEVDFWNKNYSYSLLGHNIPKCCANHLVELLFFIDRVFRENNETYLMVYGTFLGAVRHKGLIPWDTDIDLAIDESRVDIVLEILQKSIEETSYELEVDLNHKLIRLFYSKANRLHVDLYISREDNLNYYIDGMVKTYKIPLTDIYPIKEYDFYSYKLLGPASSKMLTMCYGDNVFDKAYKQWSLFGGTSTIKSFEPAIIDQLELDNNYKK